MPKFAARVDVYLRDINDRGKRVKQILWGDWLNVEEETGDGWARIKWGGERFWVNEIATAIYDERGKVIGFTKISRDLTAHRRMESQLEQPRQ